MASDRSMKFVLRQMSYDPEPMEKLVKKTGMSPGNLRKVLNVMLAEEFQLVEKVQASSPLSARWKGHFRVAWRKTRRV